MLVTIGIVHKKVHSDIALNLATLGDHLRFCLRFRPQGSLGYNQPKVFGTVFAFFFFWRFVSFQRMIMCSTFRLTLSIRGSLDINIVRKGEGRGRTMP